METNSNKITEDEAKKKVIEMFNALSKAELKVAELIAKDMSNKEIAAKIFRSEHTVRNHISNIMKKLPVSSRVGIALFYLAQLDNLEGFKLEYE